MNDAYTALEKALAVPLTAVQGRCVVGIIGTTIPREMIEAYGAMPITLTARAKDWGCETEWMETQHEPAVQSLFRQALDGDFNVCDLIAIAGTSDGNRYLYQYLREMTRQGRLPTLPPLVLVDFLLSRSPAVRPYNETKFRDFESSLRSLTGREAADAQLALAIEQANRTKRLQRRLMELRRQGHLPGGPAFMALRAAGRLDSQNYQWLLELLLGALARGSRTCAKPHILLVSAVDLYHSQLHDLIEGQGATVVIEDDNGSVRALETDMDPSGSPRTALIEWYRDHSASPRMPTACREAWVGRILDAGGIDGVVFYFPPSDQYWGWRYPDLRRLAEEKGIPSVLLDAEVLDPTAGPALRSAVESFIGKLPR